MNIRLRNKRIPILKPPKNGKPPEIEKGRIVLNSTQTKKLLKYFVKTVEISLSTCAKVPINNKIIEKANKVIVSLIEEKKETIFTNLYDLFQYNELKYFLLELILGSL